MEIKPEDIKNQFDETVTFLEGYKKGYGDALQWIANKLAQGEKVNEPTTVDTTEEVTTESK